MEAQNQPTGVEKLVRPSQPDCILAVNDVTYLSMYYKQESSDLWTGGIGLHRRSPSTEHEPSKEVQFSYFEDVGLFDGKISSKEVDSFTLLAATVQKSLRLYKVDSSGSAAPKLLHETSLDSNPVYVHTLSTETQPSPLSVVSGENGYLWRVQTTAEGLKVIDTIKHSKFTSWAAWTHSEDRPVYCGGDEGLFYLFDVKSGKKITQVKQ